VDARFLSPCNRNLCYSGAVSGISAKHRWYELFGRSCKLPEWSVESNAIRAGNGAESFEVPPDTCIPVIGTPFGAHDSWLAIIPIPEEAEKFHLISVQVSGAVLLIQSYGDGQDVLRQGIHIHHGVLLLSYLEMLDMRPSVGSGLGITECMQIDIPSDSIVPVNFFAFLTMKKIPWRSSSNAVGEDVRVLHTCVQRPVVAHWGGQSAQDNIVCGVVLGLDVPYGKYIE
jgi:hypothetical protein